MSTPNLVEAALRAELQTIDFTLTDLSTKREAILRLLRVYDPTKEPESWDNKPTPVSMNTMDMVRVVIRNAGRPLAPADIASAVRVTFGVEAPKTLTDMIWRRARTAGSGFFRNEDGTIGLHEMAPQIKTVFSSAKIGAA